MVFTLYDNFKLACMEADRQDTQYFCDKGAYGQSNPMCNIKLAKAYWKTLADGKWKEIVKDQIVLFLECYHFFMAGKTPPRNFPHFLECWRLCFCPYAPSKWKISLKFVDFENWYYWRLWLDISLSTSKIGQCYGWLSAKSCYTSLCNVVHSNLPHVIKSGGFRKLFNLVWFCYGAFFYMGWTAQWCWLEVVTAAF